MPNSAADPIIEELAAHLRATRQAERDLFGALDPDVRDAPLRAGDWSPKDHQAHLTAWKARQVERFRAARTGEQPTVAEEAETDALNAELQAARAGWPWEEIETEADAVSARLEEELQLVDPALLHDSERLMGTTFGNGPYHALTHFGWLVDAGVADAARVSAFAAELEALAAASPLPARDRGTALYNLACYHALGGGLDRAKALVREAFALRPDLIEWADHDSDLDPIREELPRLHA
jgi:hypothetical protein